MANYWAADDFALDKKQRQRMKELAAEYPETPTAEQDQEFVNNTLVELRWARAAGKYFGLLNAPERVEELEEV
jgi:hypothetical protein